MPKLTHGYNYPHAQTNSCPFRQHSPPHHKHHLHNMSLSLIPPELILTIADNLPSTSLNSLLRTCHSLHTLLSPFLTKRITTENLATSLLKRGISRNHLPTVLLALAHNASWHAPYKDHFGSCYNALRAACDKNHLAVVAALLTHYGVGEIVQSGCYHPLETALMTNDLALATVLLQHGVTLESLPQHGDSALMLTARYGNGAMAELLVRYGAKVETNPESLRQAIDADKWDVVRVLLREGVPMEEGCEWEGGTPLTGRSTEEVEAWIQRGLKCTKAKWDEILKEAEKEVYRAEENMQMAKSDCRDADNMQFTESDRRHAEWKVELYKMFIAGNLSAHWNWW